MVIGEVSESSTDIRNMKTNKVMLLIIMLVLLVSTVISVPPLTTVFTGTDGFQIETTTYDSYKQGNARFNLVHVFNETTGFLLTNETTNTTCQLYLRDSHGFHLKTINATPHEDHWEINGSFAVNQSLGRYIYTIVCKDTTAKVGGYVSGYFEITTTGMPLKDIEQEVIIGLIACLIFLSLFWYLLDQNIENEWVKKTIEPIKFLLVTFSFLTFMGLLRFCTMLLKDNGYSTLSGVFNGLWIALLIIFGMFYFVIFFLYIMVFYQWVVDYVGYGQGDDEDD